MAAAPAATFRQSRPDRGAFGVVRPVMPASFQESGVIVVAILVFTTLGVQGHDAGRAQMSVAEA